ncbi:TetR family transcriptional regulator [Corynebacterium sp.]|uniref:TetR/AcrR family transcriptional regulator n=1 Tax=Corynebacterium sp. TaxID=1720 RepID=UPI0025C1127B|nr:TetR family transcriptional regulator [Corynebacterium sp.]
MTERNTDCPGLRERKRRETRQRIEDCGTELILERGFDQVTLEEICEKAGISRRTFFNYFESKDQVASGTGVPLLDPGELDAFATADSDNIVRDILRYIGERVDNDPDTSLALSPDRETSLRIKARRRRIVKETPYLMLAGLYRFDQLAGTALETIRRHLTAFPERRRLPHLSVEQEATFLTSFLRQVIVTGPLIYSADDSSRVEMLLKAGRDLTSLADGYQDGWDTRNTTDTRNSTLLDREEH